MDPFTQAFGPPAPTSALRMNVIAATWIAAHRPTADPDAPFCAGCSEHFRRPVPWPCPPARTILNAVTVDLPPETTYTTSDDRTVTATTGSEVREVVRVDRRAADCVSLLTAAYQAGRDSHPEADVPTCATALVEPGWATVTVNSYTCSPWLPLVHAAELAQAVEDAWRLGRDTTERIEAALPCAHCAAPAGLPCIPHRTVAG
ncbi:hypothetical protein ACFVWN_00940 [Nocardiopsis flavescens]|uniref:hypothetical protein n=1 Tax=Nocardiopsis flavescens TaxID=758803 RepID=UPI00365613D0